MHELGEPLRQAELLRAAELVQPDFVIAPDKLEDASWTLARFKELRATSPFKVAAVLTGDSPEQRTMFLEEIDAVNVPMLCLPFRRPRLEWFLEQKIRHPRVHLLGMSSIHELEAWVFLKTFFPNTAFSVDTAKPIKAGLVGRMINDGHSLRGIPVSSRELLELVLDDLSGAQEALIRYNIDFLKSLLEA
jgi:hypothetical protein